MWRRTRPFWSLFAGAVSLEALSLAALYPFVYPALPWKLPLPWLLGAALVVSLGTFWLLSAALSSAWREGKASLSPRLAKLPLQAFFLRPILWTLAAIPGVGWMIHTGALPPEALSRLLGLTVSLALLLGGPICLLSLRALRRTLPAEDAQRYYAATMHHSLFFASVVVIGFGVLVTRVMYHAILGITVLHFRRHLVAMPFLAISAGLLWLALLTAWTRRPRQLLARLSEAVEEPGATELALGRRYGLPHFVTQRETETPAVGTLAPEAPLVYRSLQVLPRRLAQLSFGFWFLANAWTTTFQAYWFGSTREDSLLMLTLGSILGFCLAFYMLAWHRAVVRAGLRYLSLRLPLPYDEVRDRSAFRARMAFSFGGLLLFACFASLLATLSQFRRASTALLAEQGQTRAEAAAEALSEAPRGASPEESARALLPRHLSQKGEVLVFLSASGEAVSVGQAPPENLREFFDVVPEGGVIDLSAYGLVGGYAPSGAAGLVVALFPTERVPGIERSLLVLLSFFAVLTVASLGVVFAVSRDLTVPLEELSVYAAHIAVGDLRRIPLAESGEIGALTASFEQMRASLAGTLTRLDELNTSLEDKVAARTRELESKRQELEDALQRLTEAQAQLIHTEKMAALGFLVAGIAHDINNPVNAIQNNLAPLDLLTRELLGVVQAYQDAAAAFAADAPEAEERLSAAEKAAAALNVGEAREDLSRILRILHNGAERTAKIVASLRNFSRTGESKQKPFDLQQGLDETLELIGHHLRQRGVVLTRRYGSFGPVRGDGGALNQVFMNLLTNALDALEKVERPEITLRTYEEAGEAVVEIEDNGAGMSAEVLARLFEPFFTTKEAGQGTGLGLSISRRIVIEHGGSLVPRSAPGRGTCFTIRLPLGRGQGGA